MKRRATRTSGRPAVFLDRDGTILRERGYLALASQMCFYPFAFRALARLRKAGFLLIVVTNQSGIGRKFFSMAAFRRLDRVFRARLRRAGAAVNGVYACPHKPDAGCGCRKPAPGLIRRASREHGVDVSRSYVVGDQWRDIHLARRVGARSVLVLTGAGRASRGRAHPTKISTNIDTASRWIVRDAKRGEGS